MLKPQQLKKKSVYSDGGAAVLLGRGEKNSSYRLYYNCNQGRGRKEVGGWTTTLSLQQHVRVHRDTNKQTHVVDGAVGGPGH